MNDDASFPQIQEGPTNIPRLLLEHSFLENRRTYQPREHRHNLKGKVGGTDTFLLDPVLAVPVLLSTISSETTNA